MFKEKNSCENYIASHVGTDKIVLIKSKFNSELNTGGSINVQSQEFL